MLLYYHDGLCTHALYMYMYMYSTCMLSRDGWPHHDSVFLNVQSCMYMYRHMYMCVYTWMMQCNLGQVEVEINAVHACSVVLPVFREHGQTVGPHQLMGVHD